MSAENPKILIVDDDGDCREIIRFSLKYLLENLKLNQQVDIIEADSAKSAIQILKNSRIKVLLVITDKDMPDSTEDKSAGAQVVEAAKKRGDNPITVFVSGSFNNSMLEAGADFTGSKVLNFGDSPDTTEGETPNLNTCLAGAVSKMKNGLI